MSGGPGDTRMNAMHAMNACVDDDDLAPRRSIDGGKTWSRESRISQPGEWLAQPSVVRLPDGGGEAGPGDADTDVCTGTHSSHHIHRHTHTFSTRARLFFSFVTLK